MFDFLKGKKEADTPATQAGLLTRLKQGLAKTRASLTTGMASLLLGKKELDADLLSEIEIILLTADVGVATTEQLIKTLTQKLARNELSDTQAAFQCLQNEMKQILRPCEVPLYYSCKKLAVCHTSRRHQWFRKNNHHRQTSSSSQTRP